MENSGSFVWNQDWSSVRKNPMWHVWLLLLQCEHWTSHSSSDFRLQSTWVQWELEVKSALV